MFKSLPLCYIRCMANTEITPALLAERAANLRSLANARSVQVRDGQITIWPEDVSRVRRFAKANGLRLTISQRSDDCGYNVTDRK